MALFNKKKKSDTKIRPPTYPSMSEPQFPTYEPSVSTSETIKQAVSSHIEEPREEILPSAKHVLSEEKAVYVQIDKYKQAIDTIEVIKEKLKTTQTVLDELNELKKQEDSELEEWQQNISEIKERLAEVDSFLFEI